MAVGTTEAVGGDYVPDQEAAVWTSPDGITWSRVPHDETVFGGDGIQHMTSVTVGGPGLVAVGADGSGYGGDAACGPLLMGSRGPGSPTTRQSSAERISR